MIFIPEKNNKKVIQYKLKEINSDTYSICWLDKDIKVGSKVSLKGEEGWFKVVEKYNTIDSSSLDLNRNPNWYSLEKGEENIIY